MARVLLLLPTASYRAADFLAAAQALGAEVLVASERRLVSIGDSQLTLDLRRPAAAAEAIAAVAKKSPLDAVVAVDDQGVRVAALAAERLGLPGNPPEAAAATRDKAAMRRALAAAGVPQPEHRTVGPSDDSAAVAADVGLPCVVKPLSLSASRGVIRAYAIGVRSARGVERRCREDVAFRVLTANQVPDHATIARFRARHEDAIAGLVRSRERPIERNRWRETQRGKQASLQAAAPYPVVREEPVNSGSSCSADAGGVARQGPPTTQTCGARPRGSRRGQEPT